jgi:hypothetical protein
VFILGKATVLFSVVGSEMGAETTGMEAESIGFGSATAAVAAALAFFLWDKRSRLT